MSIYNKPLGNAINIPQNICLGTFKVNDGDTFIDVLFLMLPQNIKNRIFNDDKTLKAESRKFFIFVSFATGYLTGFSIVDSVAGTDIFVSTNDTPYTFNFTLQQAMYNYTVIDPNGVSAVMYLYEDIQ